MSGERLLDSSGIPRAYKMVEICEKAEEEGVVEKELFRELEAVGDYGVNYRVAAKNIKFETGVFLGDEAERLQECLMDRDFEAAYDLLDEHWDASIET